MRIEYVAQVISQYKNEQVYSIFGINLAFFVEGPVLLETAGRRNFFKIGEGFS